MKLFAKLSALGVALVMTASFASADTIQLGSYGTSAPNLGNQNSALVYEGGPSSTTYDIGTGGIWASPVANSSWVSQNPNSAPNGGYIAPNGTYTFSTTFTLASDMYAGSIYVMADDTTDVWLNGTLVQNFAGGPNSTCQTAQPNCRVALLVNLPQVAFVSGVNTLTFNVHQTNESAEGLNFGGSISSVPEPGSLILLGTGLFGAAGEVFRRMRA